MKPAHLMTDEELKMHLTGAEYARAMMQERVANAYAAARYARERAGSAVNPGVAAYYLSVAPECQETAAQLWQAINGGES